MGRLRLPQLAINSWDSAEPPAKYHVAKRINPPICASVIFSSGCNARDERVRPAGRGLRFCSGWLIEQSLDEFMGRVFATLDKTRRAVAPIFPRKIQRGPSLLPARRGREAARRF